MRLAPIRKALARPALLALGLALLLAYAGAVPARADGGVTEMDRRATLALWNSFSAPRKVWTLPDVKDDAIEKLALGPKPGLRQYAVAFGVKQPDGSGMGFHKITIGAPPRDPAAGKDPWTKLAELADPAVTVWKKTPGKTSEAEQFAEYAVRGIIGSVVLITDQRRPIAEGDAPAMKDLVQRYRDLLDAAKKAGLFAQVKLTLFVGDRDADGTDLGTGKPSFAVSAGGTTLRLRLEMFDIEGKAVEPKGYTLQLTGPLAKFASVEGAEADPAKHRWLVRNPGVRREVTVSLPAETDEMTKTLYAQQIAGSKEPPIGFTVRAYQK